MPFRQLRIWSNLYFYKTHHGWWCMGDEMEKTKLENWRPGGLYETSEILQGKRCCKQEGKQWPWVGSEEEAMRGLREMEPARLALQLTCAVKRRKCNGRWGNKPQYGLLDLKNNQIPMHKKLLYSRVTLKEKDRIFSGFIRKQVRLMNLTKF